MLYTYIVMHTGRTLINKCIMVWLMRMPASYNPIVDIQCTLNV